MKTLFLLLTLFFTIPTYGADVVTPTVNSFVAEHDNYQKSSNFIQKILLCCTGCIILQSYRHTSGKVARTTQAYKQTNFNTNSPPPPPPGDNYNPPPAEEYEAESVNQENYRKTIEASVQSAREEEGRRSDEEQRKARAAKAKRDADARDQKVRYDAAKKTLDKQKAAELPAAAEKRQPDAAQELAADKARAFTLDARQLSYFNSEEGCSSCLENKPLARIHTSHGQCYDCLLKLPHKNDLWHCPQCQGPFILINSSPANPPPVKSSD
jgi:hypothetical protein